VSENYFVKHGTSYQSTAKRKNVAPSSIKMSTAVKDSTVPRSKSPQPCIIKDGETKNRHLFELKDVDEGLSYKKRKCSTSLPPASDEAHAGEDDTSSLEQSVSVADDGSYEGEDNSSSDVFDSGDSTTLYPDSMSTWSAHQKPSPEDVLAAIKESGPMPIHQIKKPDEHPDRKAMTLRGMERKPSIIYFDTQATLQLAEDCRPHYCNYRFYPCVANPCHMHNTPPRVSSESDETAKSRKQGFTRTDHQHGRIEEQAPVSVNSKSLLDDENEIGPCNPNERAPLDELWRRPDPAPNVDLSSGSHLGSIILAPRLEDALALRSKLLQIHNHRVEQETLDSGYVIDMVTGTKPNGKPDQRIP
jgi:hypothetical protein